MKLLDASPALPDPGIFVVVVVLIEAGNSQ